MVGGGDILDGPVAVTPPCPCEPDEIIDVETPIAEAPLANDNDLLVPPLRPDELTWVTSVKKNRSSTSGRRCRPY